MRSEEQIQTDIAGQDVRNTELLRVLQERAMSLDEPREVDHHFIAKDQDDAARLGKALYDREYLLMEIARVQLTETAWAWNVEARAMQSPKFAASHDVAEELTRLADQFNGIYDGWGTEVSADVEPG